MSKIIDMTGRRFGRLTVASFDSIESKSKHNRGAKWKCVCDCGNVTIAFGSYLRSGNTKTCGCRIGVEFPTKRLPIETARICKQCGEEKPIEEFFYSSQKKIRRRTCKKCTYERARSYPSRLNATSRAQERNRRERKIAFEAYGGKCMCCGETTPIFLAFDHINGGGSQHRGNIRRRRFSTIARWLIAENFPKGFQILCNNCNWAKHANGVCPHQIGSAVAALSFGS